MRPSILVVAFLVLAAAVGIARPSPVLAQVGCAECDDMGMWPCAGCIYSAIWGWRWCEPSCGGYGCHVSWPEKDCVSVGDEQQLFALATGTYGAASRGHNSDNGIDRAAPGADAPQDVAPESEWTLQGLPWAQVKRNCRGYVLERQYPASDRQRIVRETRRIVV